jgi:uncharacterized repeat protein (TIGR01451 family)
MKNNIITTYIWILLLLIPIWAQSQCSNDITPPIAVCQSNMSAYLDNSGFFTLSATSIDNGSTDNCAIGNISINGLPNINFTCADIGASTVTLIVIDTAGNIDSCQTIVTIVDTIPPVIFCPSSPFNAFLNAAGFIIVNPLTIAAGTDNCSIVSWSINGQSNDTFDCSNIGINTAIITATDQSGNLAQCTAIINVIDSITPIASCQSVTIYLNNVGAAVALPASINASSLDNCGIASLLINGVNSIVYTASSIPLSPLIATLAVTDFAGNTSSCLANITVLDTTHYRRIEGNVYNDINLNCVNDINDVVVENIIVTASGNHTYYGTTDTLGNYSILVDTGNYTVAPILPSPYWQSCPTFQSIYVHSTSNHDTIDFALQILLSCPLLEVDISAPFMRRAGTNNYTVSYCNYGTIDATNATVDVTLDSSLSIVSSSIPIINQNGNIYTFNIGNLAVNNCGSFQLFFNINSSAINGQTHCSEAHIFPDSICISNLWIGAKLSIIATCNVDTVHFTLSNTGQAPFGPKTYSIFEDHVIMKVGSSGIINQGNSTIISVPALPGKTYRITVEQELGYPSLLGNRIATAVVEGCVPFSSGGFNTGFVTSFSNDNSSPFISIDCQENIFSFDPNDKAAQPKGYDDSYHYIYDYTYLDYRVRFQNTGTDTAFNIVIVDTLSSFLNPSTIKMGASSHPYTWEINGEGILKVSFINIMLPDSNVNELTSNGFFNFEIEQKSNNPIGSVINNQAAIYFDFNAPIFTNTTFHTVEENFVTINLTVDHVFEEQARVNVYPNPFNHTTTIKVMGKEYQELNLSVYDLTGRELMTKKGYSNNQIELKKGHLQPGAYFYQLEGDGSLINTGKIIVQ